MAIFALEDVLWDNKCMLYEKIEKESDDIVFVYTICGSIEEVRSLGYSSIENKLAISMDYWSINSVYPWQGVIQEVGQYILMFSTDKSISDKLIKHIEANHSYKIPMIVRIKIDITNIPYSLWVLNTLKSDEKYITESDLFKKEDENSLNKLK